MRSVRKYYIFILSCIIIFLAGANAFGGVNIDSSKNYLYILLHSKGTDSGIFDGRKQIDPLGIEFSKLKQYLENEYELDGYVYSYDLSNNELDIEHQGWEIGDRNYSGDSSAIHRGTPSLDDNVKPHKVKKINNKRLSFLEQAREDFITWFKDPKQNKNNPTGRGPLTNEIPQKYVLISHCMGGLAARHYMYGKGSNGQRYYQNDVAKVIFISTPHLGASGVMMKEIWDAAEKNAPSIFIPAIGATIISSRMLGLSHPATKYLAISAGYVIAMPVISGGFSKLFSLDYTPAFRDLKPNSRSIEELNSSSNDGEYNPIYPSAFAYERSENRIIYGRGVCSASPSTVDFINMQRSVPAFAMGLYLINNIGLGGRPEDGAEPSSTAEGRIMSFLISLMSGYPILADGDLFTDVRSVRGDGISTLKEAKIYPYTFNSAGLLALEADLTVLAWGLEIIPGIPQEIKAPILIGGALVGIGILFTSQDLKEMWGAHGKILGRISEKAYKYDPVTGQMIEDVNSNPILAQALFDLPAVGDTHCPGERDFRLLTDFSSSEGKRTGDFREVKVEAFNENRDGTNSGASIVINGKRREVGNITVKEPPNRIEGVLRDFMPKKMQYFQYSENFAAWKDVNVLNDYGHFAIDGLNLAEGQNVIAFKAKNKVGYTSNQHLMITVNTIPLLPSQFEPAPNSYTNNNKPKFKVIFSKSAYSASSLENISITSVKLIKPDGTEIDITGDPNLKVTISGGTYDKHALVEYTPDQPLDDGQYTILVVANSNVGMSQAMWTVNIDTRAPSIAILPLQPYSPRAPTTIKYTASDEAASILASVRCDLYDLSGNHLTEIATDDAIASGEHFFNWDGRNEGRRTIDDGRYVVKIKAFDLAGNYTVAETPMVIDSTPPQVLSANITPNPMSSKFNEQKLEAGISEKSQIFIKMANRSTKSAKVYLTSANSHIAVPTPHYEGKYSWSYNNSFLPGPEDGLYDIEITARDEAGNESVPYKLEGIRIDRTPPVVYAQATLPYVLSNSGASPYTTTLSYRLSETNDVEGSKGQGARVKIKLYNETDHELATVWESAPASLAEINHISWDGNSPDYSKGSYRFQIIAEDDLGNQSISYASCVKDGIAPVISFPSENNQEISGVIAIRGTAIDPDWTNSKPFKQYRVFYKPGVNSSPLHEMERGDPSGARVGEDWLTEALEVPLSNRDANGGIQNAGQRPLQNDSTLAYLYTNSLTNGTYTILVVVDEEGPSTGSGQGGESIATTRVVEVKNDPFSASVPSPYIKLYPTPSEVSFRSDNSIKLPIRFLNSVKPANVHVEIISEPRRSAAGSGPASEPRGSVIFYKYFPNLAGAPYIGQPEYRAGSDLGYYIWEDEQSWHIRWSADGNSHHFTGNLIAIGGSIQITGNPSTVTTMGNVINWDKTISGGEGGFDFTIADGKQLMITPKIDEDPTSPSPYASNIYLGISKASQEFIPIMIDLENQKMMDLASLGSGAKGQGSSGNKSSTSGIDWDGKLDTGGFADDGEYLIKVRAEGVDGFGIATDEARVRVVTPFELKNVEAINKNFSPLSAPDRVSVFYNLSKDSLVSAYVYDESNNLIATLLEGVRISGALNPDNKYSLSWRGNYPLPDSATVVTSGRYYLKLIARAVDGAGEKIEEIRDISVVPYYRNESFARLDPLGGDATLNGERIRLAEGESPYYFEAKGSGLYYPPKDFSYTLSATGSQRFTTYPYVPFAALVHRGFNKVKVNAVITLKVTYHFNDGYRFLAGDIWADGDYEDVKTYSFDFTPGNPTLPDVRKVYPRKYQGRITKIEARVDVSAKDGGYLLDTTEKWFTLPLSADGLLTDKGMFKITGNEYEQPEAFVLIPKYFSFGLYDFGKEKEMVEVPTQWPHIAKVEISLASPIQYSRLTNRFIPWVDFVCAKRAAAKDDNFSGYMNRLDKLGFPGNTYFNGPSTVAKSADAPHKDSYDAGLFPGSASSLAEIVTGGFARPKAGEIYSKTNTRFSADSASDYTAYLADEYLEFIPITAPEKGYYEFSDGTKITDSIKRYEGYKDPASFNAKAATPVKMVQSPPAGQSQTPFVFAWPGPNFTSFNTRYGWGGDNYKNLVKSAGGDPQKYDGFGSDKNICFYELDQGEISAHAADAKGSIGLSGKTLFSKSAGKSIWGSLKSIGELLSVAGYVEELSYSVSSPTANLDIRLSGAGRSGVVQAEDTSSPLSWSTEQDTNLSVNRGFIKSDFRLFNDEDFRGKRILKIAEPYRISEDYQSVPALKYTFLKYNPFASDGKTPIDNPNITLNNWEITVRDRNGNENADLEPGSASFNGERLADTFELKLKTNSSERRYVEITGNTAGPYELSYFDGSDWKNITTSYTPKSGILAWWNVNRLNGKYTVLLKSSNYIATQDIYIGTLVKHDGREEDVFSAYRRAQLKFPGRAFEIDKLATITPVTMTEIMVRNRPIIMTHGPIVEVKPSPSKFKTPQEDGIDLRPTLKFYYTLDDLKNLGLNPDPADPTKNLGLNIHQITVAGDLQVISDNEQTYDPDNQLYCFSGPLDHFSTYTLTKGKIKLSAPIVLADRYITNKDTVTIYGTAEADSELEVIISKEPRGSLAGPEPAPPRRGGSSSVGEDGKFRFENINLLQEGENYIYVYSSPKDNPEIKTVGEVMIVKDITPPTAAAYANLAAFSPNGDGKWDAVEYDMSSNEKGKLGFMVTDPEGKMLVNQELNTEKDKFIKLVWGQYGFNIYQRNPASGNWSLLNTINSSSVFADGYYNYTVYAIDEAGNISNNVGGITVLDTTPPKVLSLTASPNPFTPDDDGVKDTTSISFSLSEPSYVTAKVYREDGALFRKYSKAVGDFNYPAIASSFVSRSSSLGDWEWDGKGARNELLGGTYAYHIEAEDPVGNFTSSEVKSIIVDRAPSLIPYAYAEPDPFSPVNPKNNYTEVKYYLSRDNLQVQAAVIGREGLPIKNLVFGETQNKGEHTARWFGDFVSSYDGPRASIDPNRVGDGSYVFKVIAVDPAGGKPVEVTNTVLVDNVPPRIALQPVKVDYINKKAALTYSVPEISSVEVSVYDLSGKLVEVLDSGDKKPGSYNLVYSGLRTGNKQSYFKVIAVDQAKNEDEKNTEAFSVVPIGDLTLANASAAPNPFTPNGDVIKDQIRISYRIDGGAPEYKTKIYILDPSGATVKRVIENEPQYPGTYSFYWNGVVDNPDPSIVSYAKDGNYSYRIIISDQLGNLVEAAGDILLVSSKPVVNLSVDPLLISPNGDGLLDTALISYSVDYPVAQISSPARVQLDIVNSNGEIVFTKSFSHTPGNYTYTWDGKDNNQATVKSDQYTLFINATDALGTPAAPKSTTLNVDITNPVVNISDELGLIANPGAFSTNSNPDGSDTPRLTTLYYTLTEESYVTLKVYKIGNDQTTYAATDFNSGNYIQTLINGEWIPGGIQQSVQWDGRINNSANKGLYDANDDDYADPGKYAFIIEGKDRAENLTLKKWGGTVWIQNNVLTLRDTDQRSALNNPDPKYISPNGNSVAPSQKRARLYFYIDRTASPTEVFAPERIEAQGVEAQTKKVGKYSVKVYGDAGLTNLIKTITSEADAWAATNMWEDWDGKADDGRWTTDGIYYMVVDVKDYAGNPVNQNQLTRQVVVDNTAPQIPNAGVDNYHFSPGNPAWSLPEKDTATISYEVTDNGAKVNVDIDIFKDGNFISTLQSTTTLDANSVYYKTWDGGTAAVDGTYAYKISVTDLAGNTIQETGTVIVDRTRPNGTINIAAPYTAPDNTKYTNSYFVNLALIYSDPTSGLEDKMSFSNDNLTWTAWKPLNSTEANWILPGGQGSKTVYVRYLDKAGNYNIGDINDKITVDTEGPAFNFATNDPDHTPVDVWSQHDSPRLLFSADDLRSGLREFHLFFGAADQGLVVSPWHQTLADGTYAAKVRAYDNVGNFTDSAVFNYMIDDTAPYFSSIAVTETPLSPSWSNHNSPTITYTAYDATSGVASVQGSIDGGGYTAISSPWHPTLGEGTRTTTLKITDNAGKTFDQTYTHKIDTIAPTISSLTDATFNPYLGSLNNNFIAEDNGGGSGLSSVTARIEKTDGTLVKNLTVTYPGDPGFSHKTVWDGTNNSGDYVNEGLYKLKIQATDIAGNSSIVANADITLADNQYIAVGTNPRTILNEGILKLSWINGYRADLDATPITTWTDRTYSSDSKNKWVYINYYGCPAHEVCGAVNQSSEDHGLYYVSGDGVDGGTYISGTNTHWTGNLNKSWVRIYAQVTWTGDGDAAQSSTELQYKIRQYNRYARTCLGSNYEDNIVNHYDQTGPIDDPDDSGGATDVTAGGVTHSVWASGGKIYYRRGSSSDVKIASPDSGVVLYSPSVAADANGNAYVSWASSTAPSTIYFQVIPSNFAPVNGTVTATTIKGPTVPQTEAKAQALSKPVLLEPKDGSTITNTIRPTFKWQGVSGTTDYKVQLNKTFDTFTNPTRVLSKTVTQTESNQAIAYAIHEFDDGLAAGQWYWRVLAISGTQEAESDHWSFTIDPALTITGITNFPNPFNPNRERTTIRYRLGREADEVKVRIYDITGALVTELDGSTNAEGVNIWSKYNDIYWDGCNGRGDKVLNGIYPFEVVARVGDRSVSGRGKIAVLK